MLLEPVGAKSCSVEALDGAVAQLGEHLLCKQGVSGSIPLSSTIRFAHGGDLVDVLTLSQTSFAALRPYWRGVRPNVADALWRCMAALSKVGCGAGTGR
jgi:hypothetical protein